MRRLTNSADAVLSNYVDDAQRPAYAQNGVRDAWDIAGRPPVSRSRVLHAVESRRSATDVITADPRLANELREGSLMAAFMWQAAQSEVGPRRPRWRSADGGADRRSVDGERSPTGVRVSSTTVGATQQHGTEERQLRSATRRSVRWCTLRKTGRSAPGASPTLPMDVGHRTWERRWRRHWPS